MLIHKKDDIEFVTEFSCLIMFNKNIYVRIFESRAANVQ